MRKICAVIITGIFLILITIKAFSQDSAQGKVSIIDPYHLAIAFSKTTNLVFPNAIKSVERGSKDVLAQKAKGVENILQLKAGKVNFEETNLTVITADGKLYSYLVNYDNDPPLLNIEFPATDNINANAFFSQASVNEPFVMSTAKKVAGKNRTVYGIASKKYQMKLSLEGLYIRDDVMYYQLKVQNNSNINYDIDQFRFFIRDQKKSKRTATQELEIKPLYVFDNTTKIFDQSSNTVVFALPKLTIPDNKYLAVQLMEKDGGRHLSLSLNNNHLIHGKVIN